MLVIKNGVRIEGLKPEIKIGIDICKEVWDSLYEYDFVITSGTEGRHSARSKHYIGQAIDFRSKSIEYRDTIKRFIAMCYSCLGNDFDLILEGKGTPNEHFHLEFDPK